jgi:NAD(P)-dependent dehydrogenase (short-subunit alcohol dehydrogenase family)
MADQGIFDVSGRVALVTAAGHGLGREFSEAMAEFGADVACNDISIKRAQETVDLIKRHGHRAIAVQADASKLDEIERLVSKVIAEFGKIDILFCNAGIGNTKLLHELTIEEWDRVMDLNVRGTFLLMRAVLPIMLKQKKGSIILTSSVAGLMAGAEERSLPSVAYGASKHAVAGITKHAAVTYAKHGIRINAIAPGAHSTRPVSGIRNYEEVEKWLSKFIPMGRVGRPSEIKGLAVYLASDASSYVTGQVFVHDGGFIA